MPFSAGDADGRSREHREQISGKALTGPPVLEPDVVAVVDQEVDERGVDRGPEEVCADARPVYEQDRTAVGRPGTTDMDQIQIHAVAGLEWNYPLDQLRSDRHLSPPTVLWPNPTGL